jgi:hypothetical protein
MQIACDTCRSANNIRRPTKGRIVDPKIVAAISQMPSASITAELAMSSALAIRGCACKYSFAERVR